jgi:hypothetical protein
MYSNFCTVTKDSYTYTSTVDIRVLLSDVRELNSMASVPAEDNSFSVQSFDELVGLDQKIFSSICPGKELVL